jgi:hypothetical protein
LGGNLRNSKIGFKRFMNGVWVGLILSACGPSKDNTVEDTAACVDAAGVNIDACAAICNSKDNEADCWATGLASPKNTEEFSFGSHGCLWYDAVAVEINDAGGCTLGEKRPICGYSMRGDERCGGNGYWCEGDEYHNYSYGAGYYIEDDKVFLILDICGPLSGGRVTHCRWTQEGSGIISLTEGVEECACACSINLDAGVEM